MKSLQYLKDQFGVIENIPDVNNRRYNAIPRFSKERKPLTGLFSGWAKLDDGILTFRQYSPTNHGGKLKEGYYFVYYHIEKP